MPEKESQVPQLKHQNEISLDRMETFEDRGLQTNGSSKGQEMEEEIRKRQDSHSGQDSPGVLTEPSQDQMLAPITEEEGHLGEVRKHHEHGLKQVRECQGSPAFEEAIATSPRASLQYSSSASSEAHRSKPEPKLMLGMSFNDSVDIRGKDDGSMSENIDNDSHRLKKASW